MEQPDLFPAPPVAAPGKKLTKKLRLETVQAIIDRYPVGAAFSPMDLVLFNEMCGTSWEGAKHMRNTKWPTDPRHVHVLEGGVWETFSWNDAIKTPGSWTVTCRTMRAVVKQDAESYLNETSETDCAFAERGGCNGPLQVDHCGVPFDDIAKEFVEQHGTPELVDGPPGGGRIFKSVDMEAAWIAFHAQRATYQLLCRSHNASKGKRKE